MAALPPETLAQPMQPVTLEGRYVRLVPLSMDHCEALTAAIRDGEIWNLWYTNAPAPEEMEAEISRRLAMWETGSMLPFTVVDLATGDPVGMTSYMNVDALNRRVEIGTTWYAQKVQRTGINTEAKLLLLGYAFEQLNCIAVEFRTHFLNRESRRAIERLGAKLDGILRNHSFAKNGTLRDTCVYSTVAGEWPTVKAHLQWLLRRER